jgi:pyruvate kinase
MSRLNCGVPVYALTPQADAVTRMSLYRAVFPLFMKQRPATREELLYDAEQLLMNEGIVENGDLIVLSAGDPMGTSGGTNTLKIVRVGDPQPYKI